MTPTIMASVLKGSALPRDVEVYNKARANIIKRHRIDSISDIIAKSLTYETKNYQSNYILAFYITLKERDDALFIAPMLIYQLVYTVPAEKDYAKDLIKRLEIKHKPTIQEVLAKTMVTSAKPLWLDKKALVHSGTLEKIPNPDINSWGPWAKSILSFYKLRTLKLQSGGKVQARANLQRMQAFSKTLLEGPTIDKQTLDVIITDTTAIIKGDHFPIKIFYDKKRSRGASQRRHKAIVRLSAATLKSIEAIMQTV